MYLSSQDCAGLSNDIRGILSAYSSEGLEPSRTALAAVDTTALSHCPSAQLSLAMLNSRIFLDLGERQKAEQALRKAIRIPTAVNLNGLKKDLYKLLATLYADQELHHRAIEIVDSGLVVQCHLDSIVCLEANIPLIINKGLYLSLLDRYEAAVAIYHEADSLVESIGARNPLYQVAINNSLGNICNVQLEDFEGGLKAYKKALAACPPEHRFRTLLLSNIATTYENLGEIDSCRKVLAQTIASTDIPVQLVAPYQLLGILATTDAKYDTAIVHLRKALSNAQSSGHEQKIIWSSFLLGKTLHIKGDFNEAKPLLEKVARHYQERPLQLTSQLEVDKYTSLNRIALQEPSLAGEWNEYLMRHDSLYGPENQKKLNALVNEYEQRIVHDSLANLYMISENQSLRIRNQRLSILSLLLLIMSSLLGIYLIRKRLLKTKAMNEALSEQKVELEEINQELIYQQEELQEINAKLQDKIAAIQKDMTLKQQKEITVKSLDKIHKLNMEDIVYLKAEDDGVRIFLGAQSIWSDQALKTVREKLPKSSFIQIYRSTLININHVEWVNHSTLQMNDGTELKIGRVYKNNIKEAIGPTPK